MLYTLIYVEYNNRKKEKKIPFIIGTIHTHIHMNPVYPNVKNESFIGSKHTHTHTTKLVNYFLYILETNNGGKGQGV